MLLFARRYLFSPKSHSVINIIACLSLVSLTAPVAAVILLLSIFNGFGDLAEGMASALDADLRITPKEGQWMEIDSLSKIGDISGIEGYSFMAEASVAIENNKRQAVVKLRGVDENFGNISPITESIIEGVFQPQMADVDRLVVGNATAYKLRAHRSLGEVVNIYAMRSSPLTRYLPIDEYASKELRISGRFALDSQSEERYAFTSLRLMQELLSAEGRASAVDIKLSDGADLKKVRRELASSIGEGYEIRARQELNPTLYSIIRYEKWAIIFISTMVIALASFSLIGALTMLIIEKRKDNLTLRAMGASWSQVRQIFALEGLLISGSAISIGAIVGISLSLVQQHLGVIEIPADSFIVKAYPVALDWGDVAAIVAISLIGAATISHLVVKKMIPQ
ncbi:MAG: ABC transporter permease [Rikenellaceae bacterium]